MHMRKCVHAFMTVFLTVLLTCSCSMNFMNPQGKAEMIVIGMDYMNSKGAPSLTGTISDAREMAAAMKMVMDSKGVPFEIRWLVQEGYDVQMEISVTSVSSLTTITEDLETRLNATRPTRMETLKTGIYDARITAWVEDQKKADELKTEFEADYSGSPGFVTVKTMTLRDKPDYPSKENVEKEIKSTSLGPDDLLIIYYTGHGEIYDTIDPTALRTLLNEYTGAGMMTEEMAKAALSVEEYTELLVSSAVKNAGMTGEAYTKFRSDLNKAIMTKAVKKGALITAPTDEDPLYGLFDMERLYDIASELKCKTVIITDACYSGFLAGSSFEGVSLSDAAWSFMQSPEWPNVASMSASTNAETSKVTVVKNEEGTWQRHSMFTIEVLKRLGWIHTEKKFTYLQIPRYTISEDGGYNTTSEFAEVPGYLGRVPVKETAASFFQSIMAEWTTNTQTPQTNDTVLDIYLIP